MYQFKFYYKDGTTSQTNLYCTRPEDLYNEFDGEMEWEDFDKLRKQNLTVHEILVLGFKLFQNEEEKEYYKLEIINDLSGDVIDSIDEIEFDNIKY